MDNQPAIWVLSDAELDEVAGGKHGDGGSAGAGGGTVVEIVEISIGEIVAAASGHSTVTISLAGLGSNTTSNAPSDGHHRH